MCERNLHAENPKIFYIRLNVSRNLLQTRDLRRLFFPLFLSYLFSSYPGNDPDVQFLT